MSEILRISETHSNVQKPIKNSKNIQLFQIVKIFEKYFYV